MPQIKIKYNKHDDSVWLNVLNTRIVYNYDFFDDFDEYEDLITNNFSSAIDKLLALTPKKPTITLSRVYHNLGILYTVLNDDDNALKYLRKGMELGNTLSIFSLIAHYFKIGDYTKMIKYLEHNLNLISMLYNSVEDKEDSIFKYQIINELERTRMLCHLKFAQYYLKTNNFSKMFECLINNIKENDPVSMIFFASEYKKNKLHNVAKKYYKRAQKISSTIGSYFLGQFYFSQNNYSKAKKYWLLGIDISCPDCMYHLGKLCVIQNDFENAEMYLLMALEHNYTISLIELVKLYIKLNDDNKLIKYGDMAINKGFNENCEIMSAYFSKKHDFTNAIKYYLLFIENYCNSQNDKLHMMYHNLAQLYYKTNDVENTVKYFKLACEKNYRVAFANLGLVYFKSDDFVNAEHYCLIALKKHRYFEVNNILLSIYKNQGKYLKVIKYYVKYNLDPNICKCKFRGICEFECEEINHMTKKLIMYFNKILSPNSIPYAKHENYIRMLYIGRKYLNRDNLKTLNDYLCTSDDLAETDKEKQEEIQEEIECPLCLLENKMIKLYCGHRTCNLCYPTLVKCPICRHDI